MESKKEVMEVLRISKKVLPIRVGGKERKKKVRNLLLDLAHFRKKLCKGERQGNTFKDRILNKIFHSDLVGALNILRVGAKLLKLNFYDNLKVLLIKLCNPVKLKLIDFFYKVSPESLWIGSSRQGLIVPAGWMEKCGYLYRFEA